MNKTTFMKTLKKNQGFTLIEILVVIGIIAILAAIVLIAINPARQFQQARDSQRDSNVNAILNGIGQYIADNRGDVPTIPNGEMNSTLCNELVPTYLPAMPTDPDSSNDGSDIDCSSVHTDSVNYDVNEDGTTGRITVNAPLAELRTIEVTR